MKIPKVTDNTTYFKMSVLPFLVLENVTATATPKKALKIITSKE